MKWVRVNDNAKCGLLIVSVGMISATGLYLGGLHVWAVVGLGFMPFALGCWGLSLLLAGSRDREIYANLTADEREQFTELAKAYGRWMVLRLLPVAILIMVAVACTGLLHPQGPKGVFDYVLHNQAELLAVAFVLSIAFVFVCSPAMIRQRRAMTEFLRMTEYARRKGYSPGQR